MKKILISIIFVSLMFVFNSCSLIGINTSENQTNSELNENSIILKKYETQKLPKKYTFELAKKMEMLY